MIRYWALLLSFPLVGHSAKRILIARTVQRTVQRTSEQEYEYTIDAFLGDELKDVYNVTDRPKGNPYYSDPTHKGKQAICGDEDGRHWINLLDTRNAHMLAKFIKEASERDVFRLVAKELTLLNNVSAFQRLVEAERELPPVLLFPVLDRVSDKQFVRYVKSHPLSLMHESVQKRCLTSPVARLVGTILPYRDLVYLADVQPLLFEEVLSELITDNAKARDLVIYRPSLLKYEPILKCILSEVGPLLAYSDEQLRKLLLWGGDLLIEAVVKKINLHRLSLLLGAEDALDLLKNNTIRHLCTSQPFVRKELWLLPDSLVKELLTPESLQDPYVQYRALYLTDDEVTIEVLEQATPETLKQALVYPQIIKDKRWQPAQLLSSEILQKRFLMPELRRTFIKYASDQDAITAFMHHPEVWEDPLVQKQVFLYKDRIKSLSRTHQEWLEAIIRGINLLKILTPECKEFLHEADLSIAHLAYKLKKIEHWYSFTNMLRTVQEILTLTYSEELFSREELLKAVSSFLKAHSETNQEQQVPQFLQQVVEFMKGVGSEVGDQVQALPAGVLIGTGVGALVQLVPQVRLAYLAGMLLYGAYANGTCLVEDVQSLMEAINEGRMFDIGKSTTRCVTDSLYSLSLVRGVHHIVQACKKHIPITDLFKGLKAGLLRRHSTRLVQLMKTGEGRAQIRKEWRPTKLVEHALEVLGPQEAFWHEESPLVKALRDPQAGYCYELEKCLALIAQGEQICGVNVPLSSKRLNTKRQIDILTATKAIECKSGSFVEASYESLFSTLSTLKQLAAEHGKQCELHSKQPIPQAVKDWCNKHTIPFREGN